ncbi:uncharacterized protein LOC135688605 isoform X2 [Rhopilema esculentum]|uniref:uncharacterized protein LOC135688605 isoform X2 n=2 Tax=Rhopilema esculentum TaxID=499914 RepID=UPI0031DCAC9C
MNMDRFFIQTMMLLGVIQIVRVYGNIDEESGNSGSGAQSGNWVEPSSGMLGDEIMPLSNVENFEENNDGVEKRGKIERVEAVKTGAKRIWQYIHPYYHWANTQPAPPKPLVHTVQDGQCFDENSLCDVGHDEQCCGHASYCVDYWGVGKCLAYKQPDIYDKLLPVRMHRNNMYKAYMRKMQYLAAAGK